MIRSRFAAVLVAVSFAFACGDEPGGGGNGNDDGNGEGLEPKILAFEATPQTVPAHGGVVTLRWTTENALSGQILANGEVVVEKVWPLSEGQIDRVVTEATAFELVVQGDGGREDRKTVQVTLGEDVPVIVNFEAVPPEIKRGEVTVLRWKTENAKSVEVRDANGTALDLLGARPDEGTVAVRPLSTTTYTLVATKDEASVQETLTVNVLPVELRIFAFEQVVPGAHLPGEEVELRWVVQGADTLTLSNLEGEEIAIEEDDIANGSATITMGEAGRFRLVATQDDKTVQEDLEVRILPPPSIGTFETLTPYLTAPGGMAKLRWANVGDAHALTLERDPGEPIDLSDHGLEEGTVEVEISADTRFTLVAWNRAGEAREDVEVQLVPLPKLLSFTAVPPRVGPGETFTLSWRSEDATFVQVENELGGLPEVSDFMVDGDVQLTITADTEYVIRLYNRAGDYVEDRLVVTVGAPVIQRVEVMPPFVGMGNPTAILSWEVLGGTELRVRAPDGSVVYSTQDPEKIAAGSTTISAIEEGENPFTVEVENGLGTVTQSVATLLAGTGPFVMAFDADPEIQVEGGTVTFSWVVLPDPAGDPTTLTLTDGTTVYDVSDRDPYEDSKSFVLETEGEYEFTLVAASANGTRQRSVEVKVIGAPTVTLTASTEEYDGVAPVTLSWTSTNALGGLTLYRIRSDGTPTFLYQVPEADRASGSYEVEPTEATTYRIVADTGLGLRAQAEVTVRVGGPTIASFTATPPEVIRGDSVTLEWDVRLANAVELDIAPAVLGSPVEVTNDAFQDISATGTPVILTIDCGWDPSWFLPFDPDDEGCAEIEFPAGFAFPTAVGLHDRVVVYANGGLGFGDPYFWTTYFNVGFPLAAAPIHIAPFWDDLIGAQAWYQFGTDADGDYLVVQWNGGLYGEPPPDVDLNFQVALRKNGTFTFRYGSMVGSSTLDQALANGASATIGYQSPDGSKWAHLHFGEEGDSLGSAMPGGLSNRSWRFPLDPASRLGPNDSFTFVPADSMSANLTAFGPNGSAQATVNIVVHERAQVVARLPAEDPSAGYPFELGWTTSHADMVEVLDDAGSVLCSVTVPEEVEEGACSITEATPGMYDYVLRAHGALGHTVDVNVSVEVFTPFLIESFEADAELVELGDSVTLTWSTVGANSIALTANGADILPSGASPASGQVVDTPSGRTTYVLTVGAADGRTRKAEVVVEVRTVDLSVSVSPAAVSVGEPVTLTWNASPLDGGVPSVYLPMVPILAAYQDISTEPDAVLLQGSASDETYSTLVFDHGFTFPFGGTIHDQVEVHTNGFLSFDAGFEFEFENLALPNTDKAAVHIAPFWDDIHTRSSGRIHAWGDATQYVIQWSAVSLFIGSSTSPLVEFDLNFQVVLFADGTFEFRYGTMNGPSQPNTSCTLGDCNLDAQGASATIGYQNVAVTHGYTHHFGGSNPSSTNQPYPGGLANRAFRMPGTSSGSLTLYPTETTTYRVCAELGDHLQCEEVEVVVVP